MSTVGQMERLFKRVGKVLTISADAPVVEAAKRMTENGIGCLIVLDGPKIVGICSERDIVGELAMGEGDPAETPVRTTMTSNVISCAPDTEISKARRMMAAHGIRHLPVIVDGVAVGMVSSRDVLAYRLYEASAMLAEAKKDARAADEAKKEVLSNVSYEIRTPMNGIIGMTELVLETALTDEQREALRMVRESAQSLLSILTNILDFSEIAAGRVQFNQTQFDLREALGDCMRAHQASVAAKGLELRSEVLDDVPGELVGDRGRLQCILNNFLANAVKFTDVGEVVVQVEAEARTDEDVRVHFSVRDTGSGIPEEKQRHIFEAFRSADPSYKRKHKGAGLGLAISAKLADLMGGRIWAESMPGQGSTFHLVLPFRLKARFAEPALQPAF